MDKDRAYTEIYSLLYGKENQNLTHEHRMEQIREVLNLLSKQRLEDGKKLGKIEVINALHKLIE